MSDMLDTIIPKSDQLNYDDFAGKESIVIKITKVTKKESKDQPISIFFEGDNGKPFKPCKGMRVALINVWGDSKEKYVGKSLRLFGDPTVRWAGKDAGGIRISEASDITKPITFLLTLSKGNRIQYTVKPLIISDEVVFDLETSKEVLRKCLTMEALQICFAELIKKTVKHSTDYLSLVAVKDEMKTKLEVK